MFRVLSILFIVSVPNQLLTISTYCIPHTRCFFFSLLISSSENRKGKKRLESIESKEICCVISAADKTFHFLRMNIFIERHRRRSVRIQICSHRNLIHLNAFFPHKIGFIIDCTWLINPKTPCNRSVQQHPNNIIHTDHDRYLWYYASYCSFVSCELNIFLFANKYCLCSVFNTSQFLFFALNTHIQRSKKKQTKIQK